MPYKAMMAEKPKKNQYPAYALKSDDGEIEEHWNQDNVLTSRSLKVTPFGKRTSKILKKPAIVLGWLKKIDFHINPQTTGFCGSFFLNQLPKNG